MWLNSSIEIPIHLNCHKNFLKYSLQCFINHLCTKFWFHKHFKQPLKNKCKFVNLVNRLLFCLLEDVLKLSWPEDGLTYSEMLV